MSNLDSIEIQVFLCILMETIGSCFNISEPFFNQHPSHLFHSHFDWHSSVHGHWAYLCVCRLCNFAKEEPTVTKILSRFKLEYLTIEQNFLNSNRSFELPYGQSWLLLLLRELLDHWIEDDEELRTVLIILQSETLDRVVHWLIDTQYPEDDDVAVFLPGTTFSGLHSSWTFAYFLLKTIGISHVRMSDIDVKFNSAKDKMTTQTKSRDFHCPLALADVICGTSNAPIIDLQCICKPAKIELSNCHTPGLILTSYWPLAAQAGLGDQTAYDRVMGYIKTFMEEVEWRGDFALTTHWVPQFIFFTLWLACGKP